MQPGAPPVLASAPVSAAQEAIRYHHLDAARAFALLLGVFFHAAESFGPRNYYWAIVDCSPSQFLEDIRFACHAFRLELFFGLAGFFARLLLLRRGTGPFVRNRVQRILVPLVVGWFVVYPVLALVWLWGHKVSGRMGDMGIPAEFLSLPVWQLWIGMFVSGMFLQKFDLTHLWFLHQLLAIYALLLGVRWFLLRLDRQGRTLLLLDFLFAQVSRFPAAVFCFSLACFPLLLLMHSWVADTPKESLIPQLATTLLFGFWFLVGWFLHRQPELLDLAARRWAPHLALGAALWLSFALFEGRAFGEFVRAHPHWGRVMFQFVYAQLMGALVLGFLGLFTRFFQRPSTWSRYLADSSYWVYIVHLPLVVALQVAVGRVAQPWPLKYAFILFVVLSLCYVSYHHLVRGTFIGVQLNGRRYPVVWPWKKPPTGLA